MEKTFYKINNPREAVGYKAFCNSKGDYNTLICYKMHCNQVLLGALLLYFTTVLFYATKNILSYRRTHISASSHCCPTMLCTSS